ncbi:hypothetical protein [Bailinhaonella thermotolerans]|uniref:Uncharacterized protein n=1 Tax=Bailinhaonella thermotolerans TaxID=1070861 RepID=A0A3A4A6B8_9ACTN|nr:hypothetical protein [Bailinhaonella thermotolerans]RJL21257.1 hypothetical protein D5H75_37970 [Bailinhaonella thermotolerans]
MMDGPLRLAALPSAPFWAGRHVARRVRALGRPDLERAAVALAGELVAGITAGAPGRSYTAVHHDPPAVVGVQVWPSGAGGCVVWVRRWASRGGQGRRLPYRPAASALWPELADRWGMLTYPDGEAVWCELAGPPRLADAAPEPDTVWRGGAGDAAVLRRVLAGLRRLGGPPEGETAPAQTSGAARR